eukprot:GDKJ01021989.1.p1 GENE.GDKJ01021989.1~~GDKJ01021989.1.p1  ORF type:complete len:631 (-),score=146.62 GDKJ01021989.1:471-2363(-)
MGDKAFISESVSLDVIGDKERKKHNESSMLPITLRDLNLIDESPVFGAVDYRGPDLITIFEEDAEDDENAFNRFHDTPGSIVHRYCGDNTSDMRRYKRRYNHGGQIKRRISGDLVTAVSKKKKKKKRRSAKDSDSSNSDNEERPINRKKKSSQHSESEKTCSDISCDSSSSYDPSEAVSPFPESLRPDEGRQCSLEESVSPVGEDENTVLDMSSILSAVSAITDFDFPPNANHGNKTGEMSVHPFENSSGTALNSTNPTNENKIFPDFDALSSTEIKFSPPSPIKLDPLCRDSPLRNSPSLPNSELAVTSNQSHTPPPPPKSNWNSCSLSSLCSLVSKVLRRGSSTHPPAGDISSKRNMQLMPVPQQVIAPQTFGKSVSSTPNRTPPLEKRNHNSQHLAVRNKERSQEASPSTAPPSSPIPPSPVSTPGRPTYTGPVASPSVASLNKSPSSPSLHQDLSSAVATSQSRKVSFVVASNADYDFMSDESETPLLLPANNTFVFKKKIELPSPEISLTCPIESTTSPSSNRFVKPHFPLFPFVAVPSADGLFVREPSSSSSSDSPSNAHNLSSEFLMHTTQTHAASANFEQLPVKDASQSQWRTPSSSSHRDRSMCAALVNETRNILISQDNF